MQQGMQHPSQSAFKKHTPVKQQEVEQDLQQPAFKKRTPIKQQYTRQFIQHPAFKRKSPAKPQIQRYQDVIVKQKRSWYLIIALIVSLCLILCLIGIIIWLALRHQDVIQNHQDNRFKNALVTQLMDFQVACEFKNCYLKQDFWNNHTIIYLYIDLIGLASEQQLQEIFPTIALSSCKKQLTIQKGVQCFENRLSSKFKSRNLQFGQIAASVAIGWVADAAYNYCCNKGWMGSDFC